MSQKFSISVKSVNHADVPSLMFTVESHDDLIATVERVRNMNIVPEQEAAALAVGLKLLAGVIIRHRNEPLFAELSNTVPAFIKDLKARKAETE